MSSIAAIGVQQAMQQAVASMKAAVQSQQAAAQMLVQAVETGQELAQSGNLGTRLNVTV